MLLTAFGQIDEKIYDDEARDANGRQEVKRGRVVVRWRGVNDGARDVGADERGCFADNVEEGKEEKVFPARRDFGDLEPNQSTPDENAAK